MQGIQIIHRTPDSLPEVLLQDKPSWTTCLRKVYFLPKEDNSSLHPDLMSETDSLQYLIEVLCGLHSPLLGENEVFGQFKTFIESNKNSLYFQHHQKWLQFTMQEVKRIRSQHIPQLGSKSYGSLMRKLLGNGESVAIVGTGQLTEEIMPWIYHKKISHKKNLVMMGRNQDRLKFFENKYPHISSFKMNDSSQKAQLPHIGYLIVAAPLSHEEMLSSLSLFPTPPKKIFDLRGLNQDTEQKILRDFFQSQKNSTEIVFLKDLFESIQSQREQNIVLVENIKKEIAEKVDAFMLRSEVRPLGWEDLCA